MEHHRYALELSYHGRAYYGWQRQSGQVSVQQVLEEALSNILGKHTEVTGCGRTDRGVHAYNYWAHFDSGRSLKEPFLPRLNKHLPADIAIHAIHEMDSHWHARYDAVTRTYRYYIHYNKDPFLNDRSFWLRTFRPDMKMMEEACELLKHYNDFGIFEKKGSDTKNAICDIRSAGWKKEAGRAMVYYFEISANRFLRNMVRRITSTMLEVGIGRLSLQELKDALDGNAALKSGMAVPAAGLHLWDITYNNLIVSGEGKK